MQERKFSELMAAVSREEESSRHIHMGGQFRPGDHRTQGLVHKTRDQTLSKLLEDSMQRYGTRVYCRRAPLFFLRFAGRRRFLCRFKVLSLIEVMDLDWGYRRLKKIISINSANIADPRVPVPIV
jgi:hypothetical protein